MSLIKRETIHLDYYGQDDILLYLNNAYRLSFDEDPCDEIPDFYAIYDCFMDEIHSSDFRVFSFRGYKMSIYELLNEDMVEWLLKEFRFEFIDSNDNHVGDCQNVLLEEMLT